MRSLGNSSHAKPRRREGRGLVDEIIVGCPTIINNQQYCPTCTLCTHHLEITETYIKKPTRYNAKAQSRKGAKGALILCVFASLRPCVFAFSLFWFTSAPDNNLVVIVIKPKCSWLIFGMFSSYLGFGGDAVVWNCRTTSLGEQTSGLRVFASSRE